MIGSADYRTVRRLLAGIALLLVGVVAHAGPVIHHWETANGARVYFIEARGLPIVDARVVFAAGSARDGDRPGTAFLTATLLDMGAGEWDADAIAERIDRVGSNTSISVGMDRATIGLRSLSEPGPLQTTVSTVAAMITRPTFPADKLELERNQVLVSLRYRKQDPGKVADDAFYAALYGDHPYAHPTQGDEATVRSLTREELLAFYRRLYVARNAVVAIVGDLDEGAARQIAERLVGDLPAGEPAPPLPAPAPLTEAREIRIAHPSTQTHILIGQPGMRRGDPDYFALYLGNHALGGSGLVSVLAEEIREKRGLAYSVYSYFSPQAVEGPFEAGMQTRNDQAEEALRLMRRTLSHFVDEGITAEQFEASKTNVTGGFALRIDSNSKLVGYLAMIGFYGLPLDYLDTFSQRIESLSLDQVRDAMRRRLHPERMVTVIVGGGQ